MSGKSKSLYCLIIFSLLCQAIGVFGHIGYDETEAAASAQVLQSGIPVLIQAGSQAAPASAHKSGGVYSNDVHAATYDGLGGIQNAPTPAMPDLVPSSGGYLSNLAPQPIPLPVGQYK